MKTTHYKFIDIVEKDKGFLRGPFGSDLKKSILVSKNEGEYKVYEQGVVLNGNHSIGNYYITKDYFDSKLSRFEVKPGDFLVSCSGVNYGAIYRMPTNIEKGIINQALLRIRLNEDIVDPDFFYYYFQTYIVKKIISGTGDSTIPNFPPISEIKNIDLFLPDYSEQVKIGRNLKLFDNKIKKNKEIISLINDASRKFYEYNFLQQTCDIDSNSDDWCIKNLSEIVNVLTGKKDANFGTPDGKYAFFTCSNDVLKCDTADFSGNAILVAGNGDFNVKYYEGDFNAYQRTYVLIPDNDLYTGIVYYSVEDKIEKFKSGSNGSIVKFIKKGDIENIPIFIPKNHQLLYQLNMFLSFKQQYQNEIETIFKLKNKLLPLLINGQIKVSD